MHPCSASQTLKRILEELAGFSPHSKPKYNDTRYSVDVGFMVFLRRLQCPKLFYHAHQAKLKKRHACTLFVSKTKSELLP